MKTGISSFLPGEVVDSDRHRGSDSEAARRSNQANKHVQILLYTPIQAYINILIHYILTAA